MKLIEMKNHFYAKGFKPLRITACGGCGNSGWPHGCGGCGGYYDYSTAHFGNPPTWVSITKHEGTVRGYSMPTVVACGGYGGCGSSLNPGWIEIGGGCGRTYYSYTGCGSPGCGGPLPDSCG